MDVEAIWLSLQLAALTTAVLLLAGLPLAYWLAVTRWREDATRDCFGTFCYLRDLDSGALWSTAWQPTLKVGVGFLSRVTVRPNQPIRTERGTGTASKSPRRSLRAILKSCHALGDNAAVAPSLTACQRSRSLSAISAQ